MPSSVIKFLLMKRCNKLFGQAKDSVALFFASRLQRDCITVSPIRWQFDSCEPPFGLITVIGSAGFEPPRLHGIWISEIGLG